MHHILVVDDDIDMCMLLTRFLSKKGFKVESVRTGKDALLHLEMHKPHLILCDYRLEDMNGNELLIALKEKSPEVQVIIITGYSDVKDAVEVMKLGAYDYVTKPLYPDEILLTINKALARGESIEKNGKAKSKQNLGSQISEYITGNSPQFLQIIKQIALVAPTNYSVIIYGESGSGKEAIAQQIHQHSRRADKPFIAIDCGALSKELAGSELFGHEKGAFTGAVSQKVGSLELANTGTVFLDEIANLSYDIQVSLLRVVQERKIRRVGGVKDIDLDVRIIVASNERLWDAARNSKFREDLYHRFNEFSIEVPSLRERPEDIMLFAQHFLNMTNKELGKSVKGFSKEVEKIFKNYVWYGNLRELKNVVKRATLLTDGNYIEPQSLPFEISNYYKLQFETVINSGPENSTNNSTNNINKIPLDQRLKAANIDAEYSVILDALKKAGFNKSKAARLLNVDRKTLYNKMKQFKEFNNLDEQEF